MFARKCLATLGFGILLVASAAAMPPPWVENKVPLFPLGDEFREAWPPSPAAIPPSPPASRPGKALECEQLEVRPLEIEPLRVPPRPCSQLSIWPIWLRLFVTPFELLLPPPVL